MNHMIQSEVAAELPLHLAVLACSSLGYAATKWADKKFIQPRVAVPGKKIACDEAGEEEEAAPASTNNTDAKEPTSDPKQTNETVSEHVQAASKGEADAVPSQRVAKMLAKKAERKAKKVQQRLLEEQACDEAIVAPTTSPQQSPEDEAEKLEINGEPCENGTKEADEALGEYVADEAVESAGESSNLALDSDVSVAELSTTDERSPLAWADQEPSSDDEFFFAELAEKTEADDELFAEEEPAPQYQPSWPKKSSWNYEAHHSNYRKLQAGDGGDAWMMPFEEIMHTPEDAAQWYSLGMAPMPGMDVQPVHAADGQQFYTDGDQFFVLACADAQDANSVQWVNPVVNPCGPVHGAFLDSVIGSQPAASPPQRYAVGCNAGVEGWNRPWAY